MKNKLLKGSILFVVLGLGSTILVENLITNSQSIDKFIKENKKLKHVDNIGVNKNIVLDSSNSTFKPELVGEDVLW